MPAYFITVDGTREGHGSKRRIGTVNADTDAKALTLARAIYGRTGNVTVELVDSRPVAAKTEETTDEAGRQGRPGTDGSIGGGVRPLCVRRGGRTPSLSNRRGRARSFSLAGKVACVLATMPDSSISARALRDRIVEQFGESNDSRSLAVDSVRRCLRSLRDGGVVETLSDDLWRATV